MNQISQRESTRRANAKRRLAEQTVLIPTLTSAQRRKREKLESDPEEWIWEMCGPKSGILEPLSYRFTSQQSDMIMDYEKLLKYGGDELTLASRGEGKTTYFRASVWRSIAMGTVSFVALICASGDDATYSREAIQSMIADSEPFAVLYPEIAIPVRAVGASPQLANTMRATGRRFDTGERFEQELISFTWSQKGLWFPNVPGSPSARAMMQFRGADKAIRGLNILGRRPEIVAIDDLDTPDTVNNIDVAKKVIDRVNLDIGGLRGQSGKFARMMLATMPKQACGVAHHFATQKFPFVVKRHRYLIEKPLRWDMWMEYVKRRQKAKAAGDTYGRAAHSYYRKNKKAMDAGHKVSNPNRFNDTKLEDGTKTQLSAIQNYFDEWADKGEMFCRCELDNEIIENEELIVSSLEMGHVVSCEGEQQRGVVGESCKMVTRAIDVRKIELHHATIANDHERLHRIPDYDVQSHGTTELTVQQAEFAILEGLRKLKKEWDKSPVVDRNGQAKKTDLTLIDKGWLGNWTEDGKVKTWVTQPVETFCMEAGLRRWLPAKGQPRYRSPKPGPDVIIGDNWHMNRGEGAERSCTEVIWNAEHWHSLVEELFITTDEEQRFELFVSVPGGVHASHRRLSEHIKSGAEELAETRRRATRGRKPGFRHDHWWDALAMALVAKSVEQWFRDVWEPQKKQSVQRIRQRTNTSRKQMPEIGAR